jgi:hypothetical protein
MMELINFIGQDKDHFWGAVVILGMLLGGIVQIIKAIKNTKEEDECD